MLAAPAQAAGPLSIESFSVGSSNTEAGAHPDVTTSISMNNPGEPEAAQDVAINFPEGLFGNPQAIAVCRSVDFALNQCPGASQVGIITIHANYESDPNYLLGTAPLYNMEARGASRPPASPSSRRRRTCRSTSRSRFEPAPTTGCG